MDDMISVDDQGREMVLLGSVRVPAAVLVRDGDRVVAIVTETQYGGEPGMLDGALAGEIWQLHAECVHGDTGHIHMATRAQKLAAAAILLSTASEDEIRMIQTSHRGLRGGG